LYVYSHVIAVEEIEPETLRGLTEEADALPTTAGDAPADIEE
jgi:hypothetical protein